MTVYDQGPDCSADSMNSDVIGEQLLYEIKWPIKLSNCRIKLNTLGREDPNICGIGERVQMVTLSLHLASLLFLPPGFPAFDKHHAYGYGHPQPITVSIPAISCSLVVY